MKYEVPKINCQGKLMSTLRNNTGRLTCLCPIHTKWVQFIFINTCPISTKRVLFIFIYMMHTVCISVSTFKAAITFHEFPYGKFSICIHAINHQGDVKNLKFYFQPLFKWLTKVLTVQKHLAPDAKMCRFTIRHIDICKCFLFFRSLKPCVHIVVFYKCQSLSKWAHIH